MLEHGIHDIEPGRDLQVQLDTRHLMASIPGAVPLAQSMSRKSGHRFLVRKCLNTKIWGESKPMPAFPLITSVTPMARKGSPIRSMR